METAIRAIVYQGLKKREAAELAGITVRAIDAALSTPKVKAFRADMERARGSELHVRSIAVGERLMETAESEHVRLQAAQWINQLTDPTAHLRGAETSKTLIININQGEARLLRDDRSGTVKALPVIDVEPDGG